MVIWCFRAGPCAIISTSGGVAFAQKFPYQQFADIQEFCQNQIFTGNKCGAEDNDHPPGSGNEKKNDPDTDDEQPEGNDQDALVARVIRLSFSAPVIPILKPVSRLSFLEQFPITFN